MTGQKQIPFGNDRQNGNGKGKSGFPSGMTDRKAKAKATARQKQIPFGNDRQNGKSKGNGKGKSGFPSGMTDRTATAKAKATATAHGERSAIANAFGGWLDLGS